MVTSSLETTAARRGAVFHHAIHLVARKVQAVAATAQSSALAAKVASTELTSGTPACVRIG